MSNILTQTPKTAKLLSPPKRRCNRDLRSREYLTRHEVDQLCQAARQLGRHGHRDETLILLMFRHGLRVTEVLRLQWSQIDFKQGLLYVKRIKKGLPSTHPLQGLSLRHLRRLQREALESPYLFVSERGAPLTARTVRHLVARAGQAADLPFPVHPHMLRHGTGFYLANAGQDTRAIQSYLGHANIKNTVIYTELSPRRFRDFWED